MKDKFQKIYIGTNEGITSVVDCLVNSLESSLLLIIPPENKNFQNLITLKLLKREARTLGKNIIIISSNPTLRKLASKLGLRVIDYFQIEEVQPEIFYDKSTEAGKISDIAAPAKRPHLPPSSPLEKEAKEKEGKFKFFERLASKKEEKKEREEEEKEEQPPPIKIPETKSEEQENEKGRKKLAFITSRVFIYVLILVGLGILGFAFFSLPKAKIEVVPKMETVSFDLSISLDKGISEVNLVQKKIPAQLVRIEREAKNSFLSSGKKLKESKARGTITIYNNYSSAPQTLVATTRLISETGKLFRTTSTVNIPGAALTGGKITSSTYDVEVVAAEVGEEYNVGPSTFSIPGFAGTPKYTGFYGKSSQPMTGGFKGEIKFVTADDIKAARSSLEQQLLSLKGEIAGKIPQNLKLIDGASEIKFEEMSSPKAGDEQEKFDMDLRGAASTLVFNEEDVKKIIEENIATKIVTDKEPLPKTQKIVYSIKSINLDAGKAELSVRAEEGITWKIDTEILRKDLVSKSIPEAKEYLSSLVSIDNAKVTLWPFWIKKFPSTPQKIDIEIGL